jgi:uncharacterized protein
MHAYRDAIRGSAGAYVLFPGDEGGAPFREFGEPLPGLGAFALRPRDGGRPLGSDTLEAFLREVLDHVANRASQDERYRYWRAIVRGRAELGASGRLLPSLSAPPRDAPVLCGVLRSQGEADWVSRMETYGVPAGWGLDAIATAPDKLGAEWALLAVDDSPPVLYVREGAWYVQTREELLESGYPKPAAETYLCARFRPVSSPPPWLADLSLASLHTGTVAPPDTFVVAWADLIGANSS